MASAYWNKMEPYAKIASNKTGISVETILAHWQLETGGGTSDLSKRANNHAGIKASSKGKDYTSGAYAGYRNLTNFANDYARVMSLSYYDGVRSANGIKEEVNELDKSPWAEDKNQGKKLLDILNKNGVNTGSSGTMGEVTEMATGSIMPIAIIALLAVILFD